jgi:lambda family phage portal protein
MGIMDLFRRAVPEKRPRPVIIKRGYDAASSDRLNFSWTAGNACADDDLLRALDKLRARSRDLAYNNEYAKKYLQMVVTHIVGPNGFNLQNLSNDFGKPDELARQVIEQAFDAWSRKGVCEIGGQYAFQELQRQIIRAVARDGEALVLKLRGKDAGNAYGYALRLIEIDRLPASYNGKAKNGNRIIMGVEIDAIGKPVAYWINFGDLHLGAASPLLTRIEAERVLHIFHAERAEQHRGAPWMHAIMGGLKQLGAYSESAIVASRVGASKMGFFTAPDGDPAALAGGKDDEGEFLTDADPGTFGVLPAGYGFTPFDPDYPQANYDSFIKSCLRGISSGLGVSYNTLANDLEGVNFSSIRSGVLEERDNWIVLQNWFIESFMRPVFSDWIEAALLKGAIAFGSGTSLPANKREKFTEHTWQGRRWQWVDPLKDLNSSILAIENGLASPQSIAASMGVDVFDVLDQIKQFQDMVKSKGVTLGAPSAVPVPVNHAEPTAP